MHTYTHTHIHTRTIHRKAGYMSAIKAATPGGRGVDTIVEMLANVNLAQDLKILARGGVVAVVGNRCV